MNLLILVGLKTVGNDGIAGYGLVPRVLIYEFMINLWVRVVTKHQKCSFIK
jgi:hypothetical protein